MCHGGVCDPGTTWEFPMFAPDLDALFEAFSSNVLTLLRLWQNRFRLWRVDDERWNFLSLAHELHLEGRNISICIIIWTTFRCRRSTPFFSHRNDHVHSYHSGASRWANFCCFDVFNLHPKCSHQLRSHLDRCLCNLLSAMASKDHNLYLVGWHMGRADDDPRDHFHDVFRALSSKSK